ncbi:MAG: baseplate J/gp47 family protein [Methylocystis sp.]|nr:baseplate J/gp47 family protein [Methylocystis sp.]
MSDLPTIVTKTGMQPLSPVDIWRRLLDDVAAIRPGYTANLPGGLIEDISSTDVAAIALCDSARVELVNSLTPYGANAWLLNQLAQVYGVQRGTATNTAVNVVFNGPPGYVIPIGFTVTDGAYNYAARDGGVIGTYGQSPPLAFVATETGAWEIPPGSVTEIVTSVPSEIDLTCSNPFAGTPGLTEESESAFRARVLQAGRASAIGMPSFLKTVIGNVRGVAPRLISVQQTLDQRWKVIVGGGDPYEVAFAIFSSAIDVASLAGSTMEIVDISSGVNGVVTTALNHGYSDGEIVRAAKVQGMVGINGIPLTVEVIDEKRFKTGVNTTLLGSYTGGGELLPNHRNAIVSLSDYPDVYTVTFVVPPAQRVAVSVTWDTTAENYVNIAAVAQLGAPAVAEYVNSVHVGKPLNLAQMKCRFLNAVASVIAPELVSRVAFDVSINGIGTAPSPGTDLVFGDPESYFMTPDDGSLIIVEKA